MLWPQLLEHALGCISGETSDIFVVHLGGNDLMVRMGKSLILQVIQDLHTSRDKFPAMRILWSNIIPLWVWRADCDPRCIDRARHGVNREVG